MPTVVIKGSDGKFIDGNDQNISDVTLTVNASDPEGKTVTYTFAPLDGTGAKASIDTNKSNVASYSLNGATLGKHAVKVTVSDGINNVETYASFTIQENTPPIVKLFFVPYTAKSGSVISVKTSAVDVEGEAITYKWSVNNANAQVDKPTSAKTSIQLPTVTTDTNVTVTLEVKAGPDTITKSRVISVQPNRKPIISSKRFYNASVVVGDTVYFDAKAYDPDGAIVSYIWKIGEVEIEGETAQLDTRDFEPGSYTVSLTVFDNDEAATTEQFEDKLIVSAKNSAPVITNLTATSTALLPGEDTNLTVTATDADGDNLSITWSAASGSLVTDNDKATYSNDTVGTYTVTVNVSDGTHTVSRSIEITVKEVTFTVSASTTSAKVGSEITFSTSFSDESVVPSNVTWSLTAKPDNATADVQGNGSSATLSPDVAGTYTVKAVTQLYGITYSDEVSISVSNTGDEGNVVEGTVKDEDGNILNGAKVRLYNKDDTTIYDQTQTTGQDGAYKFTNIPAGDYYLVTYAGDNYISSTQVVTVK
jgi:hypothetical protein